MTDPAAPSVPRSPRALPRSMVVIGGLLGGLLAVLVLATIGTVITTDRPEPAVLADLPLPDGVDIVDSMPTCNESACDGEGVVLIGSGGEGVAGRLAGSWRDGGWDSRPCVDEGTLCFASADLRISMSVWSDVDPLRIPKLWEAVTNADVDPDRLVFVHVYRCGSIIPCE